MTFTKGPERIRDKKYLRHVRSFGCLVCGQYAEAHHLTFAQEKAKGLKTGDQYTVPLCHKHHMELHDSPMHEKTWWAINGIDPIEWAEKSYDKYLEQCNR